MRWQVLLCVWKESIRIRQEFQVIWKDPSKLWMFNKTCCIWIWQMKSEKMGSVPSQNIARNEAPFRKPPKTIQPVISRHYIFAIVGWEIDPNESNWQQASNTKPTIFQPETERTVLPPLVRRRIYSTALSLPIFLAAPFRANLFRPQTPVGDGWGWPLVGN